MANKNIGILSKVSAEASASYEGPKSATAATVSGNDAPTIGKPIPIIAGGARPKGEVIWCRTRRGKNNECLGDFAVCFGRNAFGRPLELRALVQNGTDIYLRKDGVTLDPAGEVRFYDGTQTAADPLIASVEGASETPAWKGYIYAVLEDVVVGDGDKEFQAEFSDNATVSSSAGAIFCDPDLAGIDLVYEETSGLYYGIQDPMTGASSIITSDGCNILNRVEIVSPARRENDAGFLIADEYPFYCDNIYPLRCSDGLVAITGFFPDLFEPSSLDVWPGYTYTAIFEASSGRMIHTALRTGTSYVVENVTQTATIVGTGTETSPEATEIEWEVSYELPGMINNTILLRRFNRSDCYAVTGPYAWPISLSSGNIAGHIFNLNNGDIVENDDSLIRTNVTESTRRADSWWLGNLPAVDEFIHCVNNAASVQLAGAVWGSGEFTVYIWDHSNNGIDLISTTDVTLPTGFAANTLNYDPASGLVLVDAKPTGSSLLSPRVYSITRSGLATYVSMPAGFSVMLPKSKGIADDGKVPIANDDNSLIGALDIETGTVETIYEGDAPESAPTVDLRRNAISIPTIDGRTSYAVSQVTANDIALSDLITDICALKGYSSSDLVFEGFTGLVVRGMTISSTTRVADLLNRLGQLYGFVFAETDGKLKFRRRRATDGSATPDVTLTDSDLIEGSENIVVQRQAATTVLGSLGLTWLDPDRDFESNNVLARRITGVLSGEAGTRDEEISLPVAIAQATARQLLFESFYAMAEAETRVSFSVGPKHLRIEPGDLVQITAGGTTRLVQARRVTHRADLNTLEIEADSFMAQATATIGSAGGGTSSPGSGAIAGNYVHLDIPLLTAAEYPGASAVRQYHGLTTYSAEAWGGADFYVSGNGSTYTKVLDYDVPPMVVGVATNALGDCPQTFALDVDSELTFEVTGGDPDDFETVDYAEMMSDLTICAYGRPGAWELLSFQTVTNNLDGTITLSNLQRGLYGTNLVYFVFDGVGNQHQVGDLVCLLNKSRLRSSVRPTSEIGRVDRYAVATADVGLTAALKPRHEMTGVSMRPPPVANIIVEHVANTAEMTIDWNATTPIPHTWEDTGAAGVMPETYTYTVFIYTQSNGNFEITTTDTSATWTEYGSILGEDALVHEQMWNVGVMVTSPIWGDSFTAYAHEIREA